MTTRTLNRQSLTAELSSHEVPCRGAGRPVAPFVADALDSIRLYTREHGVTVAGAPFVTIHPSGETDVVDAEAGWPTIKHARGSGRIHAGAIARASTVGPSGSA